MLSFSFYEPLWISDTHLFDAGEDLASFSYSTLALGGYWSADLTLIQPIHRLEEWRARGLGRRVEIAAGPSVVWEGFVNTVEAEVSGYPQTIGPYLDIINRAKLVFSAIDTSGATPVTGLRLETAWLDDANSIAQYGILQDVFSAGGVALNAADALLAGLLRRRRNPPRSEDLTLQADPPPKFVRIKLGLVGYARLMEKYIYNQTTNTGLTTAAAKVALLVQADPNGVLRLGAITPNTLAVPGWENDDAQAWSILKGIIAQGDGALNRWTFGVYGGRRANYKPVAEEISYVRPLREGSGFLTNAQGNAIEGWEVLPGRYVLVEDLAPGRPLATNLEDDPRILFAETVQVRGEGSEISSVVINGAHTYKIERRLAQLGLGGIG